MSPATANVLTCSTAQMTAAVTHETDQSVTWAATPGMIDATGLYTSPIATPASAMATVTATSVADPDASATAQLALATAFPGMPAAIPASTGTSGSIGTVGAYQHQVVARGNRAYAAWAVNPANASTVSLHVARSDDGGATWNAGTDAFSAMLNAPQTTTDAWMECPSVAIDAANPDVVYAVGRVSSGNSLGTGVGATTESTLVFALSTDGGATFTKTVLHGGGVGYCADIVSPAANSVVITDPVDVCGKDVWVWSDANRGAGFGQGTTANGGYLAAGTTHGLDEIDGKPCGAAGKIDIEQNGNTDFGGDATEMSRMFTDGAGRVCVSYIGDTTDAPGAVSHAYVLCSNDLGVTFSPQITLDPTSPTGTTHSDATGAFGPNGAAAVVWVRSLNTDNIESYLFIATSTDGGRTFGPETQVPTYKLPGMTTGAPIVNANVLYDADGILWISYRVNDGGRADRIVVDKSCDGGTTWSGPVLVNGTEDQITAATFTNMRWPALIAGPGNAPHLAAWPEGNISVFGLAP